jgi:tetratricopeptide (TPR) repeat protein
MQLALDPKFSEAIKLLEQRRYAEAIALLRPMTLAHPTNGEYWLALGLALAASEQFDPALDALGRAFHADPRPPRATYHYARLLQYRNRHQEAIAALKTIDHPDSQALLALTQSLEAVGDPRGADQAYRRAMSEAALRPRESASIQLRYAQFLLRQKSFEAALWQLNQSIRKQPFEGLAWLEKARALVFLNRLEEAADSLEQALAHGQRNKENLLLLSRIYARLGDKGKSESYRREAEP